MQNKQEIGKLGEDIACRYLINNKFKILFRNYREKFDEIDIIAKSFDGVIVFVEVKTLKNYLLWSPGLSPEDHMTKSKFYKIKRGCLVFSAKHPNFINSKKGWRIDLLAINFENEEKFKINHYENIVL